tara:strand:- start:52404 stop:54974 length:2571 start_codon:yes stop_codon:yes gene_type:complete
MDKDYPQSDRLVSTNLDNPLNFEAEPKMDKARPKIATALNLLFTVSSVIAANSAFSQTISLEQIMAEPDWIGRAPQQAYWSDDSDSIYFFQKRQSSEHVDLYRVERDGEDLELVTPAQYSSADVAGDILSSDFRLKVYERAGDIYVKNLRRNEITQLTRTAADETNPAFSADGNKVFFNRNNTLLVRDLASGLEYQAADLRLQDSPDEEEERDYIEEQQLRLFDIIRLTEERETSAEDIARESQRQDSGRPPLPFYLGEDMEIISTALSPRENWLLAVTRNSTEQEDGKAGSMPNYVSASGYVESQEVRSRVGTTDFANHQLFIFDLLKHEFAELELSGLPTLDQDPLEQQLPREQKLPREHDGNEDDAEDSLRELQITGLQWNREGDRVLFQAISRDNKDRWLLTVDTEDLSLEPPEADASDGFDSESVRMLPLGMSSHHVRVVHHNHDPAWINRQFIAAHWLPNNESIVFLSELDGYGHLYLHEAGKTTQLTAGKFEVKDPVVTRNGREIYISANVNHPGIYEIFRLQLADAELEQVTDLGGRNRFLLSPDESRLLITHSDALSPTELYVKTTRPNSRATRITHTISEEFHNLPWAQPEFIAVPSSQVSDPIHSRVYTPLGDSGAARAAVIFIHGAGYLQNAHQGWSNYFREFMFHSLLVQRGYVVLDMDYRASSGYGRDWRTAIYQQMGTPEVQDLADGIDYLVANKHVDRDRICTYGGSYGGFLTLMAMFKQPELFACGAALRPVTDWAAYNHGYTSNILNIPSLDPSAYERSSPIEFAEGLEKPLLIAHGMQDNNVFFQDSVRLVQRLIELKKENWEMAMYPIEAHGFREASSWLDEYRRILNLFTENLDK